MLLFGAEFSQESKNAKGTGIEEEEMTHWPLSTFKTNKTLFRYSTMFWPLHLA